MEEIFYESQQRLNWYIDGYFIHCLSASLFNKISTERLCEIYNVEMSFFKKNNESRRTNRSYK